MSNISSILQDHEAGVSGILVGLASASLTAPFEAASGIDNRQLVLPEDDSDVVNGSEAAIQHYLEAQLGPRRLPSSALYPLTAVYAAIFVTGIVGNVSTCLVIAHNPHLQTATNYYLFSLAVSDLMTLLLGLPNDLWLFWHQYPYLFGSAVCSIRALVSEMTNNASVLTIVTFSIERYMAICHPLYKQHTTQLSRVVKIITGLWIAACISAIPFALFTTIHYVDFPQGSGRYLPESAFCSMATTNNARNKPLLLFSSCIFFVLPMAFLVVLYAKIGLKLRRARLSRLASETHGSNSRHRSSRKVLKILVSVVVTFFICWAPFHAQRLLCVFVDADGWTHQLRDINEKLFHVAGCFYFVNCTTNPILYNVMSHKFRRAFQQTLCCCLPMKPKVAYTATFASRCSMCRDPHLIHRQSYCSCRTLRAARRSTEVFCIALLDEGKAAHSRLRLTGREGENDAA